MKNSWTRWPCQYLWIEGKMYGCGLLLQPVLIGSIRLQSWLKLNKIIFKTDSPPAMSLKRSKAIGPWVHFAFEAWSWHKGDLHLHITTLPAEGTRDRRWFYCHNVFWMEETKPLHFHLPFIVWVLLHAFFKGAGFQVKQSVSTFFI